MSDDETEVFDFDTIVERIVILENANIGCDPKCSCRALLALTLSDEQAKIAKALARRVADANHSGGEQALQELLMDATDFQDALLQKLIVTKINYSGPLQKGGHAGAQVAINAIAEGLRLGALDGDELVFVLSQFVRDQTDAIDEALEGEPDDDMPDDTEDTDGDDDPPVRPKRTLN